jgi:hypothetical protein
VSAIVAVGAIALYVGIGAAISTYIARREVASNPPAESADWYAIAFFWVGFLLIWPAIALGAAVLVPFVRRLTRGPS